MCFFFFFPFFFLLNGSKLSHVEWCFKACKNQIHIWRLSAKFFVSTVCRLSHKHKSVRKWGRHVEVQKDKTGESGPPKLRCWDTRRMICGCVGPHMVVVGGTYGRFVGPNHRVWRRENPWFLGVLKPYAVPKNPKVCLLGPTTLLLHKTQIYYYYFYK